jgi:hypothetical protein
MVEGGYIMMKYRGSLNCSEIECNQILDNKMEVFDIVDAVKKFGGVSIINGIKYSNYENTGNIQVFDNNVISLLIPNTRLSECLPRLLPVLNVLNVKYQIYPDNIQGYWYDGVDGKIAKDIHYAIEFNSNDKQLPERLRLINRVLRNMVFDWIQFSFAYYVNDSMILVYDEMED